MARVLAFNVKVVRTSKLVPRVILDVPFTFKTPTALVVPGVV